ncbi:hypothetical protein FS749_002321 [Ceratobasidium sp. UAMH 11750]|nr:hypothetical protein FS749_002321 [Ceratobasidium sp. UAMH 11750]
MPIKFFLTSRPEPAIRSRMLRRKGDRDRFELHLHELDKGVVGEDIKKYLRAGLTHPDLILSDEHLEILTERSGVLFIYAATVVRYISADDFLLSEDRLIDVLEATTGSNDSDQDISSLYNLILEQAFRRLNAREQDEMRCILGAVIHAQELLTVRVLAGLLGRKRERSVHATLGFLRSVLNVQQDESVTTLHKSFPDHMLDPARSLHFCCDPKTHNGWLAQRCFDLISTSSPLFNICRLDSSYVLDEDVPDLGQRVKHHIPEELFYACRYWGAHLRLAARSQNSLSGLYHFLSVGLLLWMEVMNLTKLMQPGIEILRQVDLREWDERLEHIAETRELAEDASQFAHAFSSSPASRSTPHVYISMLSFWPRQKPVSKYYLRNLRSPVESMTSVVGRPGSMPLGIYDLGNIVKCVAFSADGRRLVSASFHRTIHIWDVNTGTTVGRPLMGHTGVVSSVALSPGGTSIVSGSFDKTIRIWDANTGAPVGIPFIGHTGAVLSVAFSSDRLCFASGSEDKTVRIWRTSAATPWGTPLIGHTGAVFSVAFSPRSYTIASGSADKTVRIWNMITGASPGAPFTGHTGTIYSAAFSPDGSRIVSGSEDKTVRIWDIKSGKQMNGPLTGHAGAVYSVAFSSDGSRVVSGSEDKTVRIWDARTGEAVGRPLEGHGDQVYSVSFSPNTRIIGSGSADHTIRLWDVDPEQTTCKTLRCYSRASHLAYPTDHGHIPRRSKGTNLCLWDAHAGRMEWAQAHEEQAGIATDLSWTMSRHPSADDYSEVLIEDIPTSSRTWGAPARSLESIQVHHTSIGTSTSTGSSRSSGHLEGVTNPVSRRWAFDEDGWVVMGSSRRLLWVPAHIRDSICHPAGAAVEIPERNSLWVDLKYGPIGERWHHCYSSKPLANEPEDDKPV